MAPTKRLTLHSESIDSKDSYIGSADSSKEADDCQDTIPNESWCVYLNALKMLPVYKTIAYHILFFVQCDALNSKEMQQQNISTQSKSIHEIKHKAHSSIQHWKTAVRSKYICKLACSRQRGSTGGCTTPLYQRK